MYGFADMHTPLKTAAIACFLVAAFAAAVAAHSKGKCVDNVVDSCNATYPTNYAARIACVNNGIDQCNTHSHGGGGGRKPGADSFTSSSKPEQSRTKRFRLSQ